MKNLILVFSMILLTSVSFAQCDKPNSLNYLVAGGGEDFGGYNFRFYGDEADGFIDDIIVAHPQLKRKKDTWKIKKVEIDGIEKPVRLKIYRGVRKQVYNCKKNISDKVTNEEAEMPLISIYVFHGRRYSLKTKEQAKIVKEYLLSCRGESK